MSEEKRQRITQSVWVPQDAYDELLRIQREFEAEHPGATYTLGAIVRDKVLAGRKPDQP